MSFCFSDASSVGSEGSTAAAIGGFADFPNVFFHFPFEDADGFELEPFDPEAFEEVDARFLQNAVCHSFTWESLLHKVWSSCTASPTASVHPAAMKVSISNFRASIPGGLRSISS